MSQFCQAGDTARVTFPDGTVQDFTDTPVNIDVNLVWGNQCQLLLAQAYGNSSGFWGQSYIYGEVTEIKNIPRLVGFGQDVIVIARGTNNCGGYREIGVWGNYITGAAQIDFVRILDGYTFQEIPPKYKITIKNASNTVLFTDTFDSDSYSVECVQGCPLNSLDCGDCCLDCATTFNQISAIRSLISRIK